jgi:D-alanyl-lipoteichoic acid acyltransferase DltB (MBOAT superfamily)
MIKCKALGKHISYNLINFFLLLLPLQSIGPISQFPDNFTAGRTPWTGDELVARPLPKHRAT